MVRLRILILLLALASVLVTSSLGQGFVSFYGIRCGEVFEVFPDLRFDEQEPDAHYRAQLQFDDGRPIGDPIRLECSGFWGYPRQVVQGVAVGDSARIRVVVLNAANEVIAGRSAVPIVLGEEFRPADLSALLRTVDRERPSGGEDPKQSGLSLWVDSDPVVNSEDLIPTFGPRILWIPTGDLFGTDRPLLTHSGLRGPVAWGDLDGDGDLDFISLGNSVSYRCFLQQPDRTFLLREGISTGAGANGIALADFDGDDDLDAWVYQGVANDRGIQNALWLNQGGGEFRAEDRSIGRGAIEVKTGDLDGDGDIDVMTFSEAEVVASPGLVHIWANDGSGHFVKAQSGVQGCDVPSHNGTLADINGDSFPDLLYLCHDSLGVYLNRGDGRFHRFGPSYGYDTNLLGSFYEADPRVADFDNDGDLDVLLHMGNIPSTFWSNHGDGTFHFSGALTDQEREFATVADFDRDGTVDLVSGGWLYRNKGDWHYSRERSPLTGASELVDVDNDGVRDLLHVNEEGIMVRWGSQLADGDLGAVDGVEIPDLHFRRVITNALGQDLDAPISATDLARLEYLNFSRSTWGLAVPPVRDLTGLALMVNLRGLDFNGADGRPSLDVERFRLPKTLSNLTELRVSNNLLKEISLPSSLPALETLDLSGNLLSTLELHGSADRLRAVSLERNRLNRVELDASLSSLRTLNLRGNQLTELRLNVGMPELRTIDLRDNELTILLLPTDASKLQRVELFSSSVSELRLPRDPSQIEHLSLSGPWPGSDLSVFGRLTGLRSLAYSDGHFDPSQFGPLPQLESLWLHGNKAVSFRLPKGYQVLTRMDLNSVVLQSLDLPDDLHRLKRLSMVLPELQEWTVPEGLTALETIYIAETPLRTLQLRNDMAQLSVVHVSTDDLQRLVIPNGAGEEQGNGRSANIWSAGLRHVTVPEDWTLHTPTPLISLPTFEITGDQRLRFQFSSVGRRDIVIERSRDLQTWDVVKVYLGSGGKQSYRDLASVDETQSFYRIRPISP